MNNDLKHYGIKGMKWDEKKAQIEKPANTLGRSIAKTANQAYRDARTTKYTSNFDGLKNQTYNRTKSDGTVEKVTYGQIPQWSVKKDNVLKLKLMDKIGKSKISKLSKEVLSKGQAGAKAAINKINKLANAKKNMNKAYPTEKTYPTPIGTKSKLKKSKFK